MNFDKRALTWDDEYRASRAKIIAQEIKKMIPMKEDYKALEFGCGTGLISFNLYDKFKHITLVDTSRGMIEVVNSKIQQYEANNMIAYEKDINSKSFMGKYDVVYTSMVLHHIDDLKKTIENLAARVNKDGYLCIVDLTKDDGSFHKLEKDFRGHDGFEEEELKSLLSKAGLSDITYKVFFNGKKNVEGEEVDYSLFIMVASKR
ncbi:class I SAM-dependent methyltransferase [Clostridium tunisiense]|uniref:class I SAM-dependent methyltransferase n=1 Tax=Clostridium tunisiense TaxID=219748 RepID=UPI0002FA2D97|nr:class I SAM-dependent methyltransferase [Clostridium tunisiense]